MNYRLIQMVDGQMVRADFTDENLIPSMEIRGFMLTGVNRNHRQRAELQNVPKFSGVCGPMWDGDAIRYEDSESNDILST